MAFKRVVPSISGKLPPEIRKPLEAIREALRETPTKSELVRTGVFSSSGGNGLAIGPALPQVPSVRPMSAPTGLIVTGAFSTIMLSWDDASYMDAYSHVNIYRSTIDDVGTSVKVGQTAASMFADTPPDNSISVTYYYWIRVQNTNGIESGLNQTAGTPGNTANDPAYMLEVLSGQITATQLHADLSTPISAIPTIQNDLAQEIIDRAQAIADEASARAQAISDVAATAAAEAAVNLQTAQDWIAGAVKGMGATQTRVALYTDTIDFCVYESGTSIFVNDQVIGTAGAYENLPAMATGSFSVVAGDRITSNRPVALKYNTASRGVNLAPLNTASGQRFITTYGRAGMYPTIITVYAPFSAAHVKLKADSGDFTWPTAEIDVAAGGVGSFSVSTGTVYHISSNAPILVTRESDGAQPDASLVPPVAKEMANLFYAVAHAKDTDNNDLTPPNSNQDIWSSDVPGMIWQAGDGGGGDGTHGIPLTWAGDTYVVPHGLSSYRLFAWEPCTIDVWDEASGTFLFKTDMTIGRDGVNPTSRTNTKIWEVGVQDGKNSGALGAGPFLFTAEVPFILSCDDQNDDEYYPIGYRRTVRMDLIQDSAASALVAQETQLRTENDSALASDISGLDVRVTNAEGDIAGQATAISGLQTTTSQQGADISANASAITALESTANDLTTGVAANASATQNLDTRVTATESGVSSNATAIQTLQTSVDDNASAITAEQTVRADADSAIASSVAALTASVNSSTPVTLKASSGVEVTGTSATKISGSNWNESVWSLESFVGGARCSFRAGNTTTHFMAGLDDTPEDGNSYTTMRYQWYCKSDGSLGIYEAGVNRGNFGTYTTDTVLEIVYDGAEVRYLKDGTIMRTVAQTNANRVFYFDSSFYQDGSEITNITFAPYAPTGKITADLVAEQIARADADTAIASDVTVLQAKTTRDNSVLFEAMFADDFVEADWGTFRGSGELSVVVPSGETASRGGKVLQIGNNNGDDERWMYAMGDLIKFDPNKLYKLSVRLRQLTGTGVCYIGWEGIAADGVSLVNVSGSNTHSSQHYHCLANQPAGATFQEFVGYSKGHAATGRASVGTYNSPAPFHTNVAYIRPMFLVNYAAHPGILELDYLVAEDASATELAALISDEVTARTTATDALATRATALESKVGNPEGGTLASAIAAAETRTEAYADSAVAQESSILRADLTSGFSTSLAYDFNGTSEGWGLSGATHAVLPNAWQLVPTSVDPIIYKYFNAIAGALNTSVRVRMRYTVSMTSSILQCFYTTAGHSWHGGYRKDIPLPTGIAVGEWFTVEFDMTSLTAGGTDWVDNDITGIRLDLATVAGETFEVDSVAIGSPSVTGQNTAIVAAQSAAEAYADSAVASTSATLQAGIDQNNTAIAATTITAETALTKQPGGLNLIVNGDMELPDVGWKLKHISNSTDAAISFPSVTDAPSGDRVLRISGTLACVSALALAIKPNTQYRIQFKYRVQNADAKCIWYLGYSVNKPADGYNGYNDSATWAAMPTPSNFLESPSSTWTQYDAVITTVANRYWLSLAFHKWGGSLAGSEIEIDDVSFKEYIGDVDATKGAPAGTLVGGTPAETVENNASSAVTSVNTLSATVDKMQAITFISTANIVVDGNTLMKTSGSNWTESAYSKEMYRGGAVVSWVSVTGAMMLGLNTNPSASNHYNTIPYMFYTTGTTLQVRSLGSVLLTTTHAAGDVLSIEYDGAEVRWLKNGAVLWTKAVAEDLVLYFDSSFASNNIPVGGIKFGPYAPTGKVSAAVQVVSSAQADTASILAATHEVKTDVNGHVAGYGLTNNGATSDFIVNVDRFGIGDASGAGYPFIVAGGVVYIKAASIQDGTITNAKIQSLAADKIDAGTITAALEIIAPLIRSSGATALMTGNGIYMAADGTMRIGDPTGNHLLFDGTNLTFEGKFTATAIDAVDTINIADNAVTVPVFNRVEWTYPELNVPVTGPGNFRTTILTSVITEYKGSTHLVCHATCSASSTTQFSGWLRYIVDFNLYHRAPGATTWIDPGWTFAGNDFWVAAAYPSDLVAFDALPINNVPAGNEIKIELAVRTSDAVGFLFSRATISAQEYVK